MIIYSARHGETDMNKTKLVCGNSDCFSINNNGYIQADKLAEKLVGNGIGLIICSSMKRAQQTAQCVAEKLGVEIVVDKRLRERNHGCFEGANQKDPDFRKSLCQFAMRMDGGESIFDVVHRVYSVIDDIREKYADKTVLIISHGGTIGRVIESYFHDLSNNEFHEIFLSNCELRRYEI